MANAYEIPYSELVEVTLGEKPFLLIEIEQDGSATLIGNIEEGPLVAAILKDAAESYQDALNGQ